MLAHILLAGTLPVCPGALNILPTPRSCMTNDCHLVREHPYDFPPPNSVSLQDHGLLWLHCSSLPGWFSYHSTKSSAVSNSFGPPHQSAPVIRFHNELVKSGSTQPNSVLSRSNHWYSESWTTPPWWPCLWAIGTLDLESASPWNITFSASKANLAELLGLSEGVAPFCDT